MSSSVSKAAHCFCRYWLWYTECETASLALMVASVQEVAAGSHVQQGLHYPQYFGYLSGVAITPCLHQSHVSAPWQQHKSSSTLTNGILGHSNALQTSTCFANSSIHTANMNLYPISLCNNASTPLQHARRAQQRARPASPTCGYARIDITGTIERVKDCHIAPLLLQHDIIREHWVAAVVQQDWSILLFARNGRQLAYMCSIMRQH